MRFFHVNLTTFEKNIDLFGFLSAWIQHKKKSQKWSNVHERTTIGWIKRKTSSFLDNDLWTSPLKKSRFDFMILGGDFMILNDGLCYVLRRMKKNSLPISSLWDVVDLKCEKCGKKKIHPISMNIFFSTIQTTLRKKLVTFKKKKKYFCWYFFLPKGGGSADR